MRHIVVLSFCMLCACVFTEQPTSKGLPTATGWRFYWAEQVSEPQSWLNLGWTNRDWARIQCLAANTDSLFELRQNYYDHVFVKDSSKGAHCIIFGDSIPKIDSVAMSNDHSAVAFSIGNFRFLGDTAVLISPFFEGSGDSMLVRKELLILPIIKKGVIKGGGPSKDDIQWFYLKNGVDTILMAPDLSSYRDIEY